MSLKKKRRQDLAKIEDEGTNAVEIYKLIKYRNKGKIENKLDWRKIGKGKRK
jgi:hypothetical protein